MNTGKHRQRRGHALKMSFPEFDQIDKSISEQPSTKATRRKTPSSPVREEPRDSGVHSSGTSSGSGGGYSSGSSSGSFSAGSGIGGGSGTHGNGGGNNGDDGEKGKKSPWWHLPGGENNPVPDRDEEEKEDDDGGQEKMELDIPATRLQMFLPSKVDNAEQCHSPERSEPATSGRRAQVVMKSISKLGLSKI